MRVKGGFVTRRRHKKIIKMTKGQWGTRSKLFRRANEAMMKSYWYAYRDRRVRRREFRRLWITRINAASRQNGLSYSRLMHGLKLAEVQIDRKALADIAVRDSVAFAALTQMAQDALSGTIEKPQAAPAKKAKAAPKKEKEAPKKAAKKADADDLKKIEGIGPKIAGLLVDAGISTFAQLAETSEDDLVRIVRDEGGVRIASTESWAEQAQLAADGKWDELEALQDSLQGGRKA